MRQTEHNHPFFRKALEGHNPWWAFILTPIAVLMFALIGQMPLVIYGCWKLYQKFGDNWQTNLDLLNDPGQWQSVGLNLNVGLALMLLTFAGALLGLYLMIKNLHARSFKTLITPFKKINYSKIAFGFFVWLVIGLIAEAISYSANPQDYTFNFQPGPFIVLILICLTLLPIQTSFEELFVRGYLMQGFGFLTKIPFAALALSSLFFASLHLVNPEVQEYGLGNMLMYYTIAGLFLGIMTVFDDGLELALGVHFATNFSSALFVTYEGAALQTPALFKLVNAEIEMISGGFIVMALVFLGICAIRYKWPGIRYLFDPIQYDKKEKIHV